MITSVGKFFGKVYRTTVIPKVLVLDENDLFDKCKIKVFPVINGTKKLLLVLSKRSLLYLGVLLFIYQFVVSSRFLGIFVVIPYRNSKP